jgi:hypothetical protein
MLSAHAYIVGSYLRFVIPSYFNVLPILESADKGDSLLLSSFVLAPFQHDIRLVRSLKFVQ